MKPAVTVIMANYNTPLDKLRLAIESVMNQTYENTRLLLIDDWSDMPELDAFWEEMKTQYGMKDDHEPDTKFRLVKRPQSGPYDEVKHNHGHSFCRNWGVSLLGDSQDSQFHTDFVMFCDADDELQPFAVQTLIEPMLNDRGIDISVGNYTREVCVFSAQTRFPERQPKPVGEYMDKYLALLYLCDTYVFPGAKFNKYSIPLCATWNKIFRTEIFFRESYQEHEYDFFPMTIQFPNFRTKDDNFTAHWLIWAANKIYFNSRITYYYRRGGSLADSNLYKTEDIVKAHEDRMYFMRTVWLQDILPHGIDRYNFVQISQFARAEFNELEIYLWTFCRYLETNKDILTDYKDRLNYLSWQYNYNLPQLLNLDPKFAGFMVEFLEKEGN